MSGFVIAGTSSGAGKTVITTALMGILKKRGERVAPFKCGPDYIDPQFHSFVTGRDSINLDSYLFNRETLQTLYTRHGAGADISVIEGVMGLYDGMGTTELGSTALTAKMLNLPVILVVDGRGLSRSLAALVQGYRSFDRELKIAGLIINRLSGEPHYRLLEDIIRKECGLKCFGYLPKDPLFSLESRHLGLIQAEEIEELGSKVEQIVAKAEKSLLVDELLERARRESPTISPTPPPIESSKAGQKLRVAIARDKAFSFYYKDNLLLMEESGLELVPFSPLESPALPDNIDGLYLGGGYPEQFAPQLAANSSLLAEIRARLEEGLPAYAECGGLIYLTEGIYDLEGNFSPLVGHFPTRARMTGRLQRFGYVEVECGGQMIRAHEFHHSTLEPEEAPGFELLYRVKKASRAKEWRCGLSRKNVLAGYAHLHFQADKSFYRKVILNNYLKAKP